MFKSERSSQHEPFLGKYNHHDVEDVVDDEEDLAKAEARHYRHVQPTGRNYLPYLVLVFVTSFFWAGLFYLFHPDERACLHHSSTTTADNFDDGNNNNNLPNPHPNSGGFTATIPIATSPEISTTHPDDNANANANPTTTTTATTITPPLNITSHATLLTCGASVPEARARGCRYDLLLNNWVPAPCYAQEFVDEYADENNYSDAAGGTNWGGFADEALTRPLTRHQMAEAPFYWTSLRDHVVHCAVLWKKQFSAMYEFEARGVLDTVLASAGHTDHCAQYLMDFGTRNWTGPTKTEMGFAGCWVKNAK